MTVQLRHQWIRLMSMLISVEQLSLNWSDNDVSLNAVKRDSHPAATYLLYYLHYRISLTPAVCTRQTANRPINSYCYIDNGITTTRQLSSSVGQISTPIFVPNHTSHLKSRIILAQVSNLIKSQSSSDILKVLLEKAHGSHILGKTTRRLYKMQTTSIMCLLFQQA